MKDKTKNDIKLIKEFTNVVIKKEGADRNGYNYLLYTVGNQQIGGMYNAKEIAAIANFLLTINGVK